MVMNQENPDYEPIDDLAPLDVSSVKDPGMQAIVLLARSLDWNVMQKPNNPVVITSREGIQRRIPTNTSVRASLFQTLLSSVMLHSSLEPTENLMHKIVKTVKPNADIARRLLLAAGETPQQHAERLENAELAEPKPSGADVVIEWTDPPEDKKAKWVPPVEHTYAPKRVVEPEPEPKPERIVTFTAHAHEQTGVAGGPADRGEHGEIVRQGPYLAKSSIRKDPDGTLTGRVYESNTSQERVWSDGYRDYVCNTCGLAFKSSRGVGSHKQIHVRAGEAEADSQKAVQAARQLTKLSDEERARIDTSKIGTRTPREPEPEPEPVYPPVGSEAFEEPASTADILEQIKALLWPDVEEKAQTLLMELEELRMEHDDLKVRYNKLHGDWTALRDLIRGSGE